HLYTTPLAQAGRQCKGKPTPASVDPAITVGVQALLPEDYVPEVNQRLAIYQRLADVGDDDQVAQMRAQLADRFGPPPPAVVALLDVVGLRVLRRRLGVERLDAGGGRALAPFAPPTPAPP